MPPDLLLVVSGAVGALLRKLLNRHEDTWSVPTLAQVVLSGAAMVAAPALGLFPLDLYKTLTASPTMTCAFGLLVSAGGMDLLGSVLGRFTGGAAQPGAAYSNKW